MIPAEAPAFMLVKKTTFEISHEAILLVEMLKTVSAEKPLTSYQEMSAVTGRNWPAFRTQLQTARRHLAKEGKHFGTLYGIGISLSTDTELSHSGTVDLHRAHRKLTRAEQRLRAVNEQNLSPQMLAEHRATQSVLRVSALFTHRQMVAKTVQACIGAGAAVSKKQLVELFERS